MELARTVSDRERAAARTLIAEAALLDQQTASDALELRAVRLEMQAVRASVPTHDGAPQLLSLVGFGDIEEQEVLVRICSFLDQPRDRGRLACA